MQHCGANWLSAAWLCLGLLFATQVHAQTFEEGYQSYMRNQFPVAELQFRAAAKKAKTKDERAFIFKFIGICQYMRGDKRAAASSFYDGLNLDKNITIDEGEVLDPGVITYFNAIKAKWMISPEGLAAAKAVSKPPVAGPSAAAKPSPAEPTAPGRAVALEAKTPPPPQAQEKPRRKKVRESAPKGEAGSRDFSWMHFMPFGLGQFHNESYLLGSAFAIGQIYTLYQYASLDTQIKKKRKLSDDVSNNPNILQAEKDKFLPANEDFIATLVKDQNMAGASFLVLYLAGVTQSLLSAPLARPAEPSTSPETSKKLPRNTIDTAWLPSPEGGTFWVQLSLNLQ